MIRLDNNEIEKLSDATGVSVMDLQKLYAMGMLKESAALECLVRYTYGKIKKMGNYTPTQIFLCLQTSIKYLGMLRKIWCIVSTSLSIIAKNVGLK